MNSAQAVIVVLTTIIVTVICRIQYKLIKKREANNDYVKLTEKRLQLEKEKLIQFSFVEKTTEQVNEGQQHDIENDQE